MIHQTAGYERILKTWLSFHYYDVCLSYFTFSQEKWIRQTLLHLFVVHFNSELSGEHKWDPVLQSISLLWICSVKSLHRDTQASVSSIHCKNHIEGLTWMEWKNIQNIYFLYLSSKPTSHSKTHFSSLLRNKKSNPACHQLLFSTRCKFA